MALAGAGEFTAGIDRAVKIMAQLGGISETHGNMLLLALFMLTGLAICIICKNTIQMQESFRPNLANAVLIIALGTASILSLTKVTQFLYFNF